MIFGTMAPAHVVSRNSWKLLELLVLPTFSVSQSWKMLVLPTFSMISHRQIMENGGFTNISNNFYDCPNYGSVSRGFPKFMEIVGIVGFANIFRTQSWKLLVLPTFPTISMIVQTMALSHEVSRNSWKLLKLLVLPTISMIFQTMALAHEVPRNSWKLLELLVLPTFSVRQSWKLLVLPTISMIFQTMALAHEICRNSRKLLELLVLPTFSVTQSWKLLVLPTFPTIPSVLAFGGSPKKLQMFVMLTPAASNDPTGAHDAHPKFAMNRSYVLMRCVFAKWAGKVFASLIKPSSLSSTKLGNNLCLKTLLCERQFSGFFLSIRNRAILHVYGSRLYYRKTNIAVRTCLCWFNHTLPKIRVQSIYLCHVFLGVCIGGL